MNMMADDPLAPHAHDNNSEPPSADPTLKFVHPNGRARLITLHQLAHDYPQTVLPAYTYTTDHGQHGPYRLGGVALADLIEAELGEESYSQVEVISADGFGNRVWAAELKKPAAEETILLCISSNGQKLTRAQGVVRLVVPSETDNALRQIKWVATVRVVK